MKKSMTEYISLLSEDDFEILEEIFEDKYKKFVSIYWMLCDYSEYITSLKYKKTKKDTLKIEVTLSSNIDKLINNINSKISDDNLISVDKEDDNVIRIKIVKEESATV